MRNVRTSLSCALLFVAIGSLTGCYGNWPQLDTVANKVECDMSPKSVGQLGSKYQADKVWDEESHTLTVAKFDDALTVLFDQSDQQIRVVAKTASQISYGGLIRRQGDVIIVARCK